MRRSERARASLSRPVSHAALRRFRSQSRAVVRALLPTLLAACAGPTGATGAADPGRPVRRIGVVAMGLGNLVDARQVGATRVGVPPSGAFSGKTRLKEGPATRWIAWPLADAFVAALRREGFLADRVALPHGWGGRVRDLLDPQAYDAVLVVLFRAASRWTVCEEATTLGRLEADRDARTSTASKVARAAAAVVVIGLLLALAASTGIALGGPLHLPVDPNTPVCVRGERQERGLMLVPGAFLLDARSGRTISEVVAPPGLVSGDLLVAGGPLHRLAVVTDRTVGSEEPRQIAERVADLFVSRLVAPIRSSRATARTTSCSGQASRRKRS